MKAAICPACRLPVPQRPGRGRPKTYHGECRRAIRVGRRHPHTSKDMAREAVTIRLVTQVTSLLEQGRFTDDDMERLLGRSHQSVSATRRSLVKRGLVRDSGERGLTRYGNRAIKWERVPL